MNTNLVAFLPLENFSLDILLNAFLALLSILNPITVVPLAAQLGRSLDPKARKHFFNTATLAGFVTLAVLTFTGRWIMEHVFGIQVLEFRLAGGILLLILAIRQIINPEAVQHNVAPEKVLEMGIVPLAIPLMVGPGSIVTSILILDRDGWLISLIALIGAFLVCWVTLRQSMFLEKLIGHTGSMILARILWIFIGAIGMHFLITGISDVFSLPIHLTIE